MRVDQKANRCPHICLSQVTPLGLHCFCLEISFSCFFRTTEPKDWTDPVNPNYGYWMYYMFANICSLNKLRHARGMRSFSFRPHCGEAGDIANTHSCYLVANHINHGIMLRKNATTHYLYYLSQIGIAMSPLSNNKLFLDFHKNPFPKYFRQGMNVR